MRIYGTETSRFNTILSGNYFHKGEILNIYVNEQEYEVLEEPKPLYEGNYGYELESYFSGEELENVVNHARFLLKYRL